MNTQTIDTSTPSLRESITQEAAEWLQTLRTSTFSEDDPNREAATRDANFLEWVKRSAAHLLLFMEITEVERRFHHLDDAAVARIRELLLANHRQNDQ